jgi:hypothetical protein
MLCAVNAEIPIPICTEAAYAEAARVLYGEFYRPEVPS